MFDKTPNLLRNIILALHEGKVIAYPTEETFGLGRDPDKEKAVRKLLLIKNRSWKKGLILIAGKYEQLMPYFDENKLTYLQKDKMLLTGNKVITWVVPVRKQIPKWLTGIFNSLAVRITIFELIKNLCLLYGKPVISMSANLNRFSACTTK